MQKAGVNVLILLRHAKAVPEHDAPDDRSRALSAAGRSDAPLAAQAMAQLGLKPDKAIVSAAARTRETFALVCPLLGDPPAAFSEALYMAEPETVWAEAVAANAGTVLIVGHNPGLQILASMLIHQAHDRSRLGRSLAENMSPASWAAFRVSGSRLSAPGAELIGGFSPHG
jgi:phosphohistidine phosphatase